ncbi:hypothetical protein [Nitritalea halalkaliphila]|uniref:hypothetical protein n=1 Tax=Nitritalea halalkaliphila TaxID=590849 RepID=UPI0002DB4CAE|nr:hypothetical protein [Nitritalea halalkaliphila]
MGIFSLSSGIVDRAEPHEALQAHIAYPLACQPKSVLLSALQLERFQHSGQVEKETLITGTPGAYFLRVQPDLQQNTSATWHLCFEMLRSAAQVAERNEALRLHPEKLLHALEEELQNSTEQLKLLVAKADGLQCTGDILSTGRHYANVLFNNMRGGIFEENYQVQRTDFSRHIQQLNRALFAEVTTFLNSLPEQLSYQELRQHVHAYPNTDLERAFLEFLPLSFSRRHGDPSRPWNKFSIELREADGSRRKAYAGNWRDIFQNWEALALSFPDFLPGMIHKFLNASTLDGYNPYRISQLGVDWEVIEPEDPWSFIGYWGDHQLIYLLRLLERAEAHQLLHAEEWETRALLVSTHVPYRIKSWEAILANPRDTIAFDEEAEALLQQRYQELGADGKLRRQADGSLLRSRWIEKLFLPWLTKLGNFVPDAGIWMNTQRPEWNDANNALVGSGASVVTLAHMLRYTEFLQRHLESFERKEFLFLDELAAFAEAQLACLQTFEPALFTGFSPEMRLEFVSEMGLLGQNYRDQVYAGLSGHCTALTRETLQELLALTARYLRQSLRHSRRKDGLYHAYNLLHFQENRLHIDYLYEMLEGQVALLDSGFLSPEEALQLLDTLRESALYRADQNSYLLYPNRTLPEFLEKSKLGPEWIAKYPVVEKVATLPGQRILSRTPQGGLYWHPDLYHGRMLTARAQELSLPENEQEELAAAYEECFRHHAFTGRSGCFYAYEGLGSIYWHMVSKLHLAVCTLLDQEELAPGLRQSLRKHQQVLHAGIGSHKKPEEYGAIPLDPYSHTPAHRGAQQPGMTGQVKEDILARWQLLGLKVKNACLSFDPSQVSPAEWLTEATSFSYYTVHEEGKILDLAPGSLAFTYCQVPIRYVRGAARHTLRVLDPAGRELHRQENLILDAAWSAALFSRDGSIGEIQVLWAG